MTATVERTIPDLIAEYGYIETHEEAALASAKALTDQKNVVKNQIGDLMDAEGADSFTDKQTGRKAYFRTTTNHVIADADQVRQYLAAVGELDGCLKLDSAAVKKVLKAHPNIPGMEETSTASFIVSKKGGK